jgi:hypothetical protein
VLLPEEAVLLRNARFPRGPSEGAFALDLCGSILNTTGPALRDLAVRWPQDKGEQVGARLRPGTEWVVELNYPRLEGEGF